MTDLRGILNGGAYRDALKSVGDGKNVSVMGARFFEKTFFTAALTGRKLYVCADAVAARETFMQIKGLDASAVYLPPPSDCLTYRKFASFSSEPERMSALYEIARGRAGTVVTSLAALVRRYCDRKSFTENSFTLFRGEEYDLSDLKRRLVAMGYVAGPLAEAEGQYSARGDILDVWVEGRDCAVRAEFFGDTLESLKTVDAGTGLSSGEADSLEVPPATDIFYTPQQAERAARELDKYAVGARAMDIAADIRTKLAVGSCERSLEYVRPFLDNFSLFEFVRPDTVIYDDAKQIYDSAGALYAEYDERLKSLLEAGETMKFCADALTPKDSLFESGCKAVAFHRITSSNRIFAPEAVFTFDGMDSPDYSRDFRTLVADVKGWTGSGDGYTVDIFCGNVEAAKNLGDFLTDNGIGFGDGGSRVNLHAEKINRGGIFHASKRVVVGTYNISNKRAGTSVTRRNKNDVFTVPQVGDYVVHDKHGIGKCVSVEKMRMTGSERDYVVIEYAGGDKLFVPVENMDSLSKYVASDKEPKLSKIGGADFDRVKKKVGESVKKLAFDLVKVYAERSASEGFKYDGDDDLLDEFSADFPYNETEDQLTAIGEGLADLKSGRIMDRLLCGDVGYGKTEVALRLAFKVITSGKQAAFVSPTTILACQHFDTTLRRMERYGVKVRRLTRFETPAQVKETLERLKSGEIDMVCGTHRVLGRDVEFKDLGLLILDEEQRFGVEDKEKLKAVRPNVNVLSLSATPIPRTLYMTMVGVRDISVLDTPPAERIPVQTTVCEYSDALIADAISRELGRGGQAFIVYNRVAGIDAFAERLRKIMPDVRFAVAHGQMQETLLERTVSEFVAGGYDVLVSSTIIENGIDMPRANTLIVADADMLGLSQLYQLRGRVGRSNRQAYAYFTYRSEKLIGEAALRRLEAITRYTDFGSGFAIAMADLEIRGAGTLLGREQHGHMEKVGYDMYCKLLRDALDEMDGKPLKRFREVRLTVDFPAYLPEEYVPDGKKRMSLYSRIAPIATPEEKLALSSELSDMYGRLPEPAENLLEAALIKNLAAQAGAKAVTIAADDCLVIYDLVKEIPPEVLEEVGRCSFAVLGVSANAGIRIVGKRNLVNFLLNCRRKRGLND